MFKLTIQGRLPEDTTDPVFAAFVSSTWRKIADLVEQNKTDGERHMTVVDNSYTIVREFVDQVSAQEFLDLLLASTPDVLRHTFTGIEEIV